MLCSHPGSTIGFLWVITRQHLKVLIKDNQGSAAGAEAAWTGHGGLGGSPSFISPWDLGNHRCCCLILRLCGSQGKAAASDLGTPGNGAGEGATGTKHHGPSWGPSLCCGVGNTGPWGPCLASSPVSFLLPGLGGCCCADFLLPGPRIRRPSGSGQLQPLPQQLLPVSTRCGMWHGHGARQHRPAEPPALPEPFCPFHHQFGCGAGTGAWRCCRRVLLRDVSLLSAFQGRARHQRGELPHQLPLGLRHLHRAGLHGRDEGRGGGGRSQR